jgi:hypothetical protein
MDNVIRESIQTGDSLSAIKKAFELGMKAASSHLSPSVRPIIATAIPAELAKFAPYSLVGRRVLKQTGTPAVQLVQLKDAYENICFVPKASYRTTQFPGMQVVGEVTRPGTEQMTVVVEV